MSATDEIRKERLEKVRVLREKGIDPYPAKSFRTHSIQVFLSQHESHITSGGQITLAGRVMSLREHGGSIFADLYDGSGKAQLYLQKDTIGDDVYDFFTKAVDRSDLIEASGVAFVTKRGMPSLRVSSWRMLAKSLQPIPDEWYGLKDEDERYRKRYIDILLSKDIVERVVRRSRFWNTMRAFLLERDFVEVETPVLETTTGGADAKPFITHHNALDIDVYLRISAGELWQKKLMIAGLPKVFELGRIFRNEGMSFEHLQDYTQLEFYEAYKDYEAGMEMVTDMYREVADKVFGTRQFRIKDHDVNLGAAWEQFEFSDLLKKQYGIDPLETSIDEVTQVLKANQISFESDATGIERGVDLLWKQIRKTISGPAFLVGVPVYLEPLAKRNVDDPRKVDRFQVLLGGSENGKGYSELNDPVDQAERFQKQQVLRDLGDEEAQMNDKTFVEALEYGMPPTLGFGVSERLFGFLEGVSLREAQIFPLMRPK